MAVYIGAGRLVCSDVGNASGGYRSSAKSAAGRAWMKGVLFVKEGRALARSTSKMFVLRHSKYRRAGQLIAHLIARLATCFMSA